MSETGVGRNTFYDELAVDTSLLPPKRESMSSLNGREQNEILAYKRRVRQQLEAQAEQIAGLEKRLNVLASDASKHFQIVSEMIADRDRHIKRLEDMLRQHAYGGAEAWKGE